MCSMVFLFCFGISSVFGQVVDNPQDKTSLSVTVTEAGTENPIEMATVYIIPVGDTLVTSFGFTDKRGVALLKFFDPGKYNVNVQILGFKPYTKVMEFYPRILGRVEVKLEEDLEGLEGAKITEMGDLVTMKGDTLIYNATSFQTGSNANLGDLLKKMPGIEVVNGQVSVNGEPVKRITVEGKTFFFDDQSKALENLPAFIVNKIKVFDSEDNRRPGMRSKKKEMDVRLKEEYRESWFGRTSVEGGASVRSKKSDIFNDDTKGLYNAKLYAQFYGEKDTFTLLGGGNNVNHSQLSRASSGVTDVASGGLNYNTSRINGYETNGAATYDFRNNMSLSDSRRTSFLSSGEQLAINRSQKSNDITHSAKADFSIGDSQLARDGFKVTGRFLYNRKNTTNESKSSTENSKGEELNGSESLTDSNSDNFSARVKLDARYDLDREMKHRVTFGGLVDYNGKRGNSSESAITRFNSLSERRSLLYNDKYDGISLNGYLNYSVSLSPAWQLYSELTATYDYFREYRDADNAVDHSRNDYYSRRTTGRRMNLKQDIFAQFRTKRTTAIQTDFGLIVYEDNLKDYSKSYGVKENTYDSWQISIGPQLRISSQASSWHYSFYTNGKTMTPTRQETDCSAPDFSNPVDISTGNIYLKTGYRQDFSLSVIRGSKRRGSNFMDIRLRGAMNLNEIIRASWYDLSAIRYSIPVNSKHPAYNVGLNVTYSKSLNKKRSLNLTITPKADFRTGTMYVSNGPLKGIDQEKFDYADMMKWLYGDKNGSEFYSGRSGFIENRTQNLTWAVNADLKYELKNWSLREGLSATNTCAWYSASPDAEINNWRINTYTEALWKNRQGWEVEGRLDFNWYRGFSSGYNKPDWLLNMRIAKTIKLFTISLSAYDILDNSRSFSHIASAEYVEDTYRNSLGRCILLGVSFNFGKWSFARESRMKFMEKASDL